MFANNQALLDMAEMTKADGLAESLGQPVDRLMEAAGWAVAMNVRKRYRPCRALVLAGPGNNGGDGFAAARYLRRWGWPVRLALLGKPDGLKGAARLNFDRWQGGVLEACPKALEGADLVIDALFGAGLSRPLEGTVAETIDAIKVPVVAVDIPSGVCGDSGRILGTAPKALLTVTFFRKKPGHCLMPGRGLCGEIVLADIGLPDQVLEEIRPKCFENGPELWRLPGVAADAHKYSRGHALIVAGEMPGAARLASAAARKCGAGMVTVAAPRQWLPVIAADQPGLVLKECETSADLEKILASRKFSAALIGPGLGLGKQARSLVATLLKSALALVLDADALSAFESRSQELFDHLHYPALLTPHEGEFKRLFERSADKLASARQAARMSGASVLLKGPDTVVASPDGLAVIETKAPPALATAGSGDVLAGIAVSLIAQGMTPFWAGAAAAHLHGQAGNEAGRGLVAEDLPKSLFP